MGVISAAVLAVCIFQVVVSEELPSDFKKCSMKDKTCLKEAINDALPKLASGLKSLGVPPLDPLHLEKISIASGKIVQLVQNYDKLDVIGLSTGKLTDVSFDLDKGKLTVDFTCPKIEMKGSYSIKGKILVLDVYGTGKFSILPENIKGNVVMDIQKYEQKGETYVKATNFMIDLMPDHVSFKFDNLFDGNKQLGDNINNVLNDNWKEIYDELKGGYFKTIGSDVVKLTNKLFEKIPLKNLFTAS